MAGVLAKPAEKLEEGLLSGDEADALRPVAQLLGGLEPSLVLLADNHGHCLAVSHLRQPPDWHAADILASSLTARLAESRKSTFAVLTEAGYGLAFALRLPATAGHAILGGVVALADSAEEHLGRLYAALTACGAATWTAIAAQREIADLKTQLRQARKLQTLGQLAAGIAHEINTPAQYIRDNTRFVEDAFDKLQALLAACLQFREAAQHEAVTQEIVEELAAATAQADLPFLMSEVPAAIDQSLDGIDRVARILHSLQEFAHPNGGQQGAVDLNRAVQSAAAICRSQWKQVAELVTDLDPRMPPLRCPPDDVHQILINLLINAAHAIEEKLGEAPTEKGTITVRTRRRDGWADIRVEDTGTGIPEEARQRVFDRFFTTKQPGRGTGQGLAIVRSLVVDQHGGTITFTTQLGRGTAFIVRIPIQPENVGGGSHGHEEANPVC
jgi:signal transduction histidine kinase